MSLLDSLDYLEKACSRIVDRRTRELVREELAGHLEDKMERLLQRGMIEQEACETATQEMGDVEILSLKLGRLHTSVPRMELHSAMTKLFWGLLLQFFTLSVWRFEELGTTVGIMLLLAASYQLKEKGRLFSLAFYVTCMQLIHQAGSLMLGALPPPIAIPQRALAITGSVLMTLFLLLISAGLSELPSPLYKGRRPAVGLCGLLYGCNACLSLWASAADFISWPLVIVAILVFCFILRQIQKMRRWLYDQYIDGRPLGTRGWGVVLCGLAMLIAIPLIGAYIASTPAYQAAPYLPELHTAEDVRARLTREGLAEGLIADLPKDELLSIAGYQEILDQRYDIVHTGDGGILKICTAVLRMNEHDCRIYYRLLWEQTPAGGYRDECMPYLSGANLIGEPYVQLLFETNDETFFMDPLSLKRTGETIRIEYRVLPHAHHQRLLVAVKSQMEPHLIYGLFHIHRESFFLYPYQESVLSADENTVYYGETAGYDRYHTFWRIEEAGEPTD